MTEYPAPAGELGSIGHTWRTIMTTRGHCTRCGLGYDGPDEGCPTCDGDEKDVTAKRNWHTDRAGKRIAPEDKVITVGGSVSDEKGHGDGAYDLLGSWTVDDFLAELRETLMGDWGLTHAEGVVTLNIDIRKGIIVD